MIINLSKLVSIIMPVYNAEPYLNDSIESILCQDYNNFEFIIIDDGSNDNSLEILKHYERLDDRIKVYSRENRGVTATRNELIEKASGEYIAQMDADDISLPDRISKQVNLINETNSDICGCHWLFINTNGISIDSRLSPMSTSMVQICLTSTVPYANGSTLFRKSFLDENHIYFQDGYASEDYKIWVDCANKGAKFCTVDDFLFKYRVHNFSLSKRIKKSIKNGTNRLRKYYISENKNIILTALQSILDIGSLSYYEQAMILKCIVRIKDIKMAIKIIPLIQKKPFMLALVDLLRNA